MSSDKPQQALLEEYLRFVRLSKEALDQLRCDEEQNFPPIWAKVARACLRIPDPVLKLELETALAELFRAEARMCFCNFLHRFNDKLGTHLNDNLPKDS